MPKFPSIHSFFPVKPISVSRGDTSIRASPGDGFLQDKGAAQVVESIKSKSLPISSLQLGMTDTSITGRVVNISDSGKKDASSTRMLQVAIRDDTGVIEVRFWLSQPLSTHHLISKLSIGRICTIIIPFVGGLDPASYAKSPSTTAIFASLPESSVNSRIFPYEDTESNIQSFRAPLPQSPNEHMMSLQILSKHELDAACIKTLLAIRFIGPRKRVPLKDGRLEDKVEVGVFDETAEGRLTVWGLMVSSTSNWNPGQTILLLTSPKIKIWNGQIQLSISRNTLIELDPELRDAHWLRGEARRRANKCHAANEFPETSTSLHRILELIGFLFTNKDFQWEILHSPMRVRYTLADLDSYSRVNTTENYVGFLSVLVLDMRLSSLYKKRMLCCSLCTCGRNNFSNKLSVSCDSCGKDVHLHLNPIIFGIIADETGCIHGGNLIVSERAWASVLGISVQQMADIDMSIRPSQLEDVEQRILFSRITLLFGWSMAVGKLAIWDIM